MTDHPSTPQDPKDRTAFRRSVREAAYNLPSPPARPEWDGFMSCPCGRGDYDLCAACPYDWCSVHGDAKNAPKEEPPRG